MPASAINRLLKERPSKRSLAIPWMTIGSPGMEVSRLRDSRCLRIARYGTKYVFALCKVILDISFFCECSVIVAA